MHLEKRGPDNKSLTLKTHSIKLPSSPRQLSFNVKLSEYFFTAENISILKESFLTLHKIQIFFKDCSNFVLTLQTSNQRKQNDIKSLIFKLPKLWISEFKCLLIIFLFLQNVVLLENCLEFQKISLFYKNSEIFHTNQNV